MIVVCVSGWNKIKIKLLIVEVFMIIPIESKLKLKSTFARLVAIWESNSLVKEQDNEFLLALLILGNYYHSH